MMSELSFQATLAEYQERNKDCGDDPIADLEADLYARAGVGPEDKIQVHYDLFLEEHKQQPGWLLWVYSDDFQTVLFKDGKPMAGMYASFRGVYQAGGWLVNTKTELYANNFREGPHNVWIDVTGKGWIDPEIAKDGCEGKGPWDGGEEREED